MSRTVWGYIYGAAGAEAAYFVQWIVGAVAEHGAHFDLIIGKWGEGATSTDRVAVSLEFRRTERGPQFMVINANDRPASRRDLVGRALVREDVIGTPMADAAFELVDHIWLHDPRIREITQNAA